MYPIRPARWMQSRHPKQICNVNMMWHSANASPQFASLFTTHSVQLVLLARTNIGRQNELRVCNSCLVIKWPWSSLSYIPQRREHEGHEIWAAKGRVSSYLHLSSTCLKYGQESLGSMEHHHHHYLLQSFTTLQYNTCTAYRMKF